MPLNPFCPRYKKVQRYPHTTEPPLICRHLTGIEAFVYILMLWCIYGRLVPALSSSVRCSLQNVLFCSGGCSHDSDIMDFMLSGAELGSFSSFPWLQSQLSVLVFTYSPAKWDHLARCCVSQSRTCMCAFLIALFLGQVFMSRWSSIVLTQLLLSQEWIQHFIFVLLGTS